MKTKLIAIVSILMLTGQMNAQITAPGVKWADSYTFDRYNSMKIDFYSKNNELMRTFQYKTWYNAGSTDLMTTAGGLQVPKGSYSVCMDAPAKGSDIETIIDMNNEVAIQIFGTDAPEPMYNAGRFKYPEGSDIKKLELLATEETKTIAGYPCKQYTYTYKAITGSVWVTTEVGLPNDFGIFRAGKMSALHNTLSKEGFVMEMTSEDSRGGKTIMTTLSVGNQEKRTVTLPKDKVGTAINKVSYFTY